jgi:hypothetical protein
VSSPSPGRPKPLMLVVNGPSRGEFDARYGGQGAAFASSNPPPILTATDDWCRASVGKSPMARKRRQYLYPYSLQVAADAALVIDLCRSALSLITN